MAKPVDYLGPVEVRGPGGDSQPHKIRFDDGRVCVVKFGDNPNPNFGLRVLPAELVASQIAARIGVRTPEFCVVDIPRDFLRDNPNLVFQEGQGRVRQPKPGPCLASPWVHGGNAVSPENVPKVADNLRVLASLFVADNLLCMNDDHSRDYGNLLVDTQSQLWVLDWGHPFAFWNWRDQDSSARHVCPGDWSWSILSRFVCTRNCVSRELLSLAHVRRAIPTMAVASANINPADIAEAFSAIPPQWEVSAAERRAALDFVVARARVLPEIVQAWLADGARD